MNSQVVWSSKSRFSSQTMCPFADSDPKGSLTLENSNHATKVTIQTVQEARCRFFNLRLKPYDEIYPGFSSLPHFDHALMITKRCSHNIPRKEGDFLESQLCLTKRGMVYMMHDMKHLIHWCIVMFKVCQLFHSRRRAQTSRV